MDTTNQQDRPLTADELDIVAGGMTAVFAYGGFSMQIDADANGYEVCTNGGSGTRCVSSQGPFC
jgi:hypothetical protein